MPLKLLRRAAAASIASVAVRGAFCAAAPLSAPGSVSTEATSASAVGRSNLRVWREGTVAGGTDRADPAAILPSRTVIVVVGITGAGKSSTANTLSGRTHRAFKLSGSLTSVTSSSAFRDYTFLNNDWRVIDTPGLFDTNRPEADTRGELARLARFAPHGVAAFLFVVPRGRFTAEHEKAIRGLLALFGPRVSGHCIVAVTAATSVSSEAIERDREPGLMSRDALLEEINALPASHFFRLFVDSIGQRVVPVENRQDPERTISRMALHQRVLDVLEANGGATFDCAEETAGAVAHRHLSHNPAFWVDNLGECSHNVGREGDGPLVLTIRCVVKE